MAAEQGQVAAQFNLGVSYDECRGVQQDFKQAYIWFSLAAANNLNDAATNRDFLASKLTPARLEQAQQEAGGADGKN